MSKFFHNREKKDKKDNIFVRILNHLKNPKFQRVFYPVLYFVLIIGVIASGSYAFDKLYYENIYVSGTSMNPTLLGGSNNNRCHYGKADKSKRAIDNLKRFDVVITYFPEDWSTEPDVFKIKRVWGFPGETINLNHTIVDDQEVYTYTVSNKNGEITDSYVAPSYKETLHVDDKVFNETYAHFSTSKKTFRVQISDNGVAKNRSFNYTLKNDEYFLMGDNWAVSSDSYKNRDKTTYITSSLLQGKVVQILGTARYVDGQLVDKKPIHGMFEF